MNGGRGITGRVVRECPRTHVQQLALWQAGERLPDNAFPAGSDRGGGLNMPALVVAALGSLGECL
jgi:hypothetical protein